MISFRAWSGCGPDSSRAARPSFLYRPIRSLLNLGDRTLSRRRPTSSHISAPSRLPIVISNTIPSFLVHVELSLNRRNFRECNIMASSCSVISTMDIACVMALSSRSTVMEEYNSTMSNLMNVLSAFSWEIVKLINGGMCVLPLLEFGGISHSAVYALDYLFAHDSYLTFGWVDQPTGWIGFKIILVVFQCNEGLYLSINLHAFGKAFAANHLFDILTWLFVCHCSHYAAFCMHCHLWYRGWWFYQRTLIHFQTLQYPSCPWSFVFGNHCVWGWTVYYKPGHRGHIRNGSGAPF